MNKPNKKTTELLNILKKESIKYDEYLCNNEEYFINGDVTVFWKKVIEEKDMKKSDIINKADVGYTFFYDILNGKKHPSRDTLLKIFIAMQLSIDTCQEGLRIYEWAALYPKVKRDSVIIYAIMHKYSLRMTEELLEANNEKVLKNI